MTTDKRKRIIAISNCKYREAGLAFLADKKNYQKLENDSCHNIENQANKLIKRINTGHGFTKGDLEKLHMVGSKPGNFFLNIKDHKKKMKMGNILSDR